MKLNGRVEHFVYYSRIHNFYLINFSTNLNKIILSNTPKNFTFWHNPHPPLNVKFCFFQNTQIQFHSKGLWWVKINPLLRKWREIQLKGGSQAWKICSVTRKCPPNRSQSQYHSSLTNFQCKINFSTAGFWGNGGRWFQEAFSEIFQEYFWNIFFSAVFMLN